MAMWPLDLAHLPAPVNAGLLAAAAGLMWAGGSRLTVDLHVLSDRLGLAKAFTGLLLLAGITSLPEVATTTSAATLGNAPLAASNLLGAVAMQTALLTLVDLVALRRALTFFTPRPVMLVQGVMVILLLALTLAAWAIGEPAHLFGVGAGAVLVGVVYVATVRVSARYEQRDAWVAVNPPEPAASVRRRGVPSGRAARSTLRLGLGLGGAATAMLVAGWLLAATGDVLARQTGLGSTFVGATLLAVSSSLPELGTTLAAARIGAYGMAVSNILGSNAIDVALLAVADVAYREGPLLQALERDDIFTGAVGIVLTCAYLWGLLERRDRTVLRMGVDSVVVLVVYLGGLALLHYLA